MKEIKRNNKYIIIGLTFILLFNIAICCKINTGFINNTTECMHDGTGLITNENINNLQLPAPCADNRMRNERCDDCNLTKEEKIEYDFYREKIDFNFVRLSFVYELKRINHKITGFYLDQFIKHDNVLELTSRLLC